MILTFVSAVANNDEKSVLTAVQLLWVNLIMDTFAALALATDAPTPSILNRLPEPKSAPLISITMWKMIIGQSIFQLAVTLVLYFAGNQILSYQTEREQAQLQTLIFNTFVWMQIFNQYNNRRLDNKMNIFEGVHRNWFFIGIQFIIVGCQILIVMVGGRAFSVRSLNGAQWGYSIIIGLFSIPVAMILRMIPDSFVRKLIPSWLLRKTAPKVIVDDAERQYEWNPGLEAIRDDLTFLKKIRGGRLNMLKYKLQHPELLIPRSRSTSSLSRTHSNTNSVPPTPNNELAANDLASPQPPPTPDSRKSTNRRGRSRSNSTFGPAAAMAGVVAGSIAGWSPIGRREDDAGDGHAQNDDHSHLGDQDDASKPGTNNSRDPLNPSNPPESSHSQNSLAVDTVTSPPPPPMLLTPPPKG